jgi:hypothetical protein
VVDMRDDTKIADELWIHSRFCAAGTLFI